MSKQTVAVGAANWDEEVIHSTAPVLVDFWAPWCAPCRALAPSLEEVATELSGRVKVAKLNVDESPEIAQRYGISSIPTLLVFHGGRVAAQHVGALPKDRLSQLAQSTTAVA
jgi:thioredoxin 1